MHDSCRTRASLRLALRLHPSTFEDTHRPLASQTTDGPRRLRMAGPWFVAKNGHGPTGYGCDAFPDGAFAGGVSVTPQLGQAVRVEVCHEYLPQNAPFLRVPADGGLEDPGELLGHQRGLLPAVVVCGDADAVVASRILPTIGA
jgi:hypothetical protein